MKRILLFTALLLMVSYSVSYSQIRLSIQAGVEIPTGDFGDLASTGFGISGTAEYMQNTPLSFTGSVGYNTWGEKSTPFAGYDYSLSVIPIVVGLRYYLSPSDFNPYVGAELGIFFASTKTTINLFGVNTTATTSSSDFGFTPMIGMKYRLSTTLDLDANLKYNIITTSGSSTTFLGINAGVQFAL